MQLSSCVTLGLIQFNSLCPVSSWCYLQCRVLVTNVSTEQAQNSYKCRAAIKFSIPVVSVDFLHDCVRNGQVSNPEPFFILGKTKSQLFQTGVIPAPGRVFFIFLAIQKVTVYIFDKCSWKTALQENVLLHLTFGEIITVNYLEQCLYSIVFEREGSLISLYKSSTV